MTDPADPVDCLIVGGGPAGLTAAIYLARFRRNVLLFDDQQSRAAWIPTSHNYPGFAGGISGNDLLAALWEQATRYGATLRREHVDDLRRGENGVWQVKAGNRTVFARKVLLATGIIDEKPALPSMPEFVYRGGLRFCPICDGFEVIDQRVAVIGPLERAAKKALFLRTYTADLAVLPLERLFRPSPEIMARLREAGIRVPDAPVVDLTPNGEKLVATMANGESIEMDVLYPAMGAQVRSELVTPLGAGANPEGCLFVDGHQRTSVEGLYAAGDVVMELHQLSVATGHAAVAATDIHNTLPFNPR